MTLESAIQKPTSHVTTRSTTLNAFLGHPWRANAKGPDAYDCWHLAVAVSAALFDRTLPALAMPADPSWHWMIDTIRTHPERAQWRECPAGPLVTARDGAIVLMARMTRPAHCGVWLALEKRIIHADPDHGSVCETLQEVKERGWRGLRYYEPIEAGEDATCHTGQGTR